MIKKKRRILIILDFDGVLVDSIKVMEIAWIQTIEKFNLSQKFFKYKKFIGLPFYKILSNLGIKKNQMKIYKMFNHISIKNQRKIRMYKGVKQTLKYFNENKFSTAIVTSKDKSRVSRLKKILKIPISNIVCPSIRFRGKPYPDQIFEAIKKSKINPEKVYFVGDMYVDYLTAKNAKINFIFAKYGYGQQKAFKNKKTIKNFKELKRIIK